MLICFTNGIYITGQSGYDIRPFQLMYRDASQEGERKGGGREKRLPRDPEAESLQGVSSSSCCAKTHRRGSHVTPDLRWHGQHCLTAAYTYPQSTLLPSPDFYA